MRLAMEDDGAALHSSIVSQL